MAAAASTTSALRFVSGCGGIGLVWLAFALGVGDALGAGWGLIAGASSGASTRATGIVMLVRAATTAGGVGPAEDAS